MNGVEVDLHHHTHSRHEYDEDGIAINKGDWLCNECHCWNGKDRKAHPTHRKKLEYLLDKQARLEYYGGWTEDREALRFYLHEYFQSSVEYNIPKQFPLSFSNIICSILLLFSSLFTL